MNVAEAMAQALTAEGVRLAAGITGQSVGHLADALAERPQVKVFYTRQERVAVDICDGYARASGRPGVIFTDSGPAAANAMGGIVNSWGDSTPVLFIAGHVDRGDTPRRQTKEIPFKELFAPVSKWVATIDHPGQVAEIMRRAFMQLRSGRLGPGVIGLPYDVSSMPVENFAYAPVSERPPVRSAGDPDAIAQAAALLAGAQRPYVYVGSGVLWSEASGELIALAELLTLPVATTLNGKSAFPEDHPLSLGIGGFAQARYGTSHATAVAEAADVVLTIGCGFKQHATMAPMPKAAAHIQVDIDAAELHKEQIADVAILGDAKLVLQQLIEAVRKLPPARLARNDKRLAEIAALRAHWDTLSRPLLTSDEAPLNPFRVTAEFAQVADPDTTILLHDAGSVRGTTCMHYVATKPRSFLGFGVQSAMGWSLGAAIGAKTAAPDKLVATVIGEEAFAETALDIETSIRGATPILVIVLNNRAFTDRDGGVSAKLAAARFHGGIEICTVARALGAHAHRVERPDALRPALQQAIDDVRAGTSAVVEVLTRRVKTNLARG
jgi:thiamine pyrophosphate-dependent acetolactate synthase large subunit-like protein